ncbi:hypothetical protein BDV41DRAFT_540342, partial [Aspergillus transmontanensis]
MGFSSVLGFGCHGSTSMRKGAFCIVLQRTLLIKQKIALTGSICITAHSRSLGTTSLMRWSKWETFRWINDACLREETAQTPLLGFQGRALQHYHGTHLAGTKVETVDISPELAKVRVSILCEI